MFSRFDICEAYYLFSVLFLSSLRTTCREYDRRLAKIRFHARPSLRSPEKLEEAGLECFDKLCAMHGVSLTSYKLDVHSDGFRLRRDDGEDYFAWDNGEVCALASLLGWYGKPCYVSQARSYLYDLDGETFHGTNLATLFSENAQAAE